MWPDLSKIERWLRRHAGFLVWFSGALFVTALPSSVIAPVKSAYQLTLAPAKAIVRSSLKGGELAARYAVALGSTAQDIVIRDQQIRELRAAVTRLESERDWLAASRILETPAADGPLAADLVVAHPLGHQSRAALVDRQIIDRGKQHRIEAEALLIEASTDMVDRGQYSEISAGALVLCSGRVWGKVVEAAASTSTVCRVQDAAFRDVVALLPADGSNNDPQQGILYGTGAALCEVRFVPVSAPVEVGDLVISTTGVDLGLGQLRYGRIVHCERPAGAHHWQIRVKPDIDRHAWCARVAVVRTQPAGSRLAQNGKGR